MSILSPKVWLFGSLIAIGFLVLLSRSPVVSLTFYFAWLTVEDLVRKLWGNDMTVYFAKFVLLLVIIAHLLLLQSWCRNPIPRAVAVPMTLWTLFVLVNSLNPNLVHPLESLFGIHADLLYLLVFFAAGYWFVKSQRDAVLVLVPSFLFLIFPTVVAVLQQIYGPQYLNVEVLEDTELRPILERDIPGLSQHMIQVSSVFVDPGRFAGYSGLMFWLAIATGIFFHHSKGIKTIAWMGTGMAAMDVLLAGNRRVLVTCIAVGVILVLQAVIRAQEGAWRRLGWLARHSLPWALLAGIAFSLLYFTVPSSVERARAWFVNTLLGAEERPSEISERVPGYVEQLSMISAQGLFGHGTGSVALGRQYLERRFGIRITPPESENGFADKAFAYGLIGLAIWLWLLTAMLGALWKAGKAVKDAPRYWFISIVFSYALFWFTAVQLLGSSLQDYLFQSYFWLWVGMALRCPHWAGVKATSSDLVSSLGGRHDGTPK